MALTTPLTVKGRKRKQPISFGGKDYDPRPQTTVMGGKQTATSAVGNWQSLVAPRAPRAPQPVRLGTLATGPAGIAPGKLGQEAPGGRLADDAQAAAARAQAIFDATQKRAELEASGALEAADLAEAVRRIRMQRPDEEASAKNAANASGLASSGYLMKQLGDIAGSYVRREGDAKLSFDRAEAARQAAAAQAQQQAALAQAAIDAELADRQAARDAQAADAGALPTPAVPPPAVAAAVSQLPPAVARAITAPAVVKVAEKARKKR